MPLSGSANTTQKRKAKSKSENDDVLFTVTAILEGGQCKDGAHQKARDGRSKEKSHYLVEPGFAVQVDREVGK